MLILEKDISGPKTPLRKVMAESEIREYLFSEILDMLNSWDSSLLTALIEGQLPRRAEIRFTAVSNALQRLNGPGMTQPSIYLNCICDARGMSPTPIQWLEVCRHMDVYVSPDGNDLATVIDQLISPSYRWPASLAQQNLRRYTEWKSLLQRNRRCPAEGHREMVRNFANQVR